MSLCRVFGEDEQSYMHVSFMYMMVLIFYFGVDVIFYFASFLAKEIHNGLIGIAKSSVEKPSGWYSMLMHMFLFKGATYFGEEMELTREHDGEVLPI